LAIQAAYGIGADVETIFAQRETGLYRDGMRMPDGRFVSLQDLPTGVGAYVPTLLEREGARRNRVPEAVD
jgi:hypothetical protein